MKEAAPCILNFWKTYRLSRFTSRRNRRLDGSHPMAASNSCREQAISLQVPCARPDECNGDVSPIDFEQLDSTGCKSGIPRPYPFSGAAARLSDNLRTLLTTIQSRGRRIIEKSNPATVSWSSTDSYLLVAGTMELAYVDELIIEPGWVITAPLELSKV